MLQIIFKNLEKSQIAKDIAEERFSSVIGRFPSLKTHKVKVTLRMDNSPAQAGPDVFSVKAVINGPVYQDIVIEKSAANLYAAVADVVEHTLERLNRHGDRKRVRSRRNLVDIDSVIQTSQYTE
jgi:ribosome-associated translation inhibitor RaiA